jgi:acyl-coenzyme A synthetase/AMP-(fatty) acid ligase
MNENPDAEILSVGDRTIVVEELARMSASVAVKLVKSGSTSPVVTLVDRSVSSVAALLGVQWSGRALVPMNVDDPISRIREVIDRLGDCSVVDATGRGPREVAGYPVESMVAIQDVWMEPVAPLADAVAMIVFTSGSTGKPKGIVRRGWQEDSSLARFLDAGEGSKRTVVFGPLHWLGGLSLVRNNMRDGYVRLADPMSVSADALIEDLSTHRIETISATPSLVVSLARSATRRIDTLSLVACVGEPLKPETIHAARSLGSVGVTLLSHYGASEIGRAHV